MQRACMSCFELVLLRLYRSVYRSLETFYLKILVLTKADFCAFNAARSKTGSASGGAKNPHVCFGVGGENRCAAEEEIVTRREKIA